jgi:hypothetical protein
VLRWLVPQDSCQQIDQAISSENDPPIANAARTSNVARREHRSRCDHRAIHISALRNPYRSAVPVTIFVAISKLSFPHDSKSVFTSSVS